MPTGIYRRTKKQIDRAILNLKPRKPGFKQTDEWKEKMRGRVPWNKGTAKSKYEINLKKMEWKAKNISKSRLSNRRNYLSRKFNISINDVDKLLFKQLNKCSICGKSFTEEADNKGRVRPGFCVDHDHSSGIVRGLLCHNCNVGIGNFKDNSLLLRAAADYLDEAYNDKAFFKK